MATEIQFGPSLNAAVATQGAAPEESNPFVQQQKQPAPILGVENVRVTSGAVSDLEKLVARLKSEDVRSETLDASRASSLAADSPDGELAERQRKFGMMMKPFQL